MGALFLSTLVIIVAGIEISLLGDASTPGEMTAGAVAFLECLKTGSRQTYEHPALLGHDSHRPWWHPGAEEDVLPGYINQGAEK